jgi:PKD repeat protein
MAKGTHTLLTVLLLVLVSCKEEKDTALEVAKRAKACFSIQTGNKISCSNIHDESVYLPGPGQSVTVNYTDSVFVFKNCSDSLRTLHRWDFGDGQSSQDKDPTHGYLLPGTYKVTLSTLVAGKIADTTSRLVRVITGEKYFTLRRSTHATDVTQTDDKGFVVLGFGGTSDANPTDYYLARFDSLFRKVWVKTFPFSQYMRNMSIEATSDGGVIIAGSLLGGQTSFAYGLTKVDASGTVLWSRTYSNTSGEDGTINTYAEETADKGFITIGEAFYRKNFNEALATRVLKTDNNGNVIWKRLYADETLAGAWNIKSLPDGYVFAASKRGYDIDGKDSLSICKLDLNGNVKWLSSQSWREPEGALYNRFYVQMAVVGNYYMATDFGNPIVMIFDHMGKFVTRKLRQSANSKYVSKSSNDKFLVLDEGMRIEQFDVNGNTAWSRIYGNCATAIDAIKVKPLREGGMILIGNKDEGDKYSVYMVKLSETGLIK